MSENENVFDGLVDMVISAAMDAKDSGLSAGEYEWNEYELADSIRSAPAKVVQEAYDVSLTDEGAVQLKQTAQREAANACDPTLALYIECALDAALIGAVHSWVEEERGGLR